jgi:putative heme iron utilization protein
MNADHADSLVLLSKAHADLDGKSAAMTSVDRLGFHVRVETPEGMKSARIPFIREVMTPGEARTVLIAMVQQAREAKTAIPA